MGKIVVEIPDEIVAWLRLPEAEAAARVRREIAVRLYEKGIASFGLARKLAGMTRWEFHILLGEENVVRSYDIEEFEKDMEGIGGLK